MNESSPCKDCADRHEACHGSCEKYKAWRDRYQAQQKHLEEQKGRWHQPWTNSSEKMFRSYLKHGSGKKKGGIQ